METRLKKIPLFDLVEGWKTQRRGRDKAVYQHPNSGIKFDVWIENGFFHVRSNTTENKVVRLKNEIELKKFLFKIMCMIDNYTI